MDTEDAAEHMEQAHEAEHHGKDPFDKRVAGTMAVIAVILAITAMLSHAANGRTLAKQIESGKAKTEASDQWSFFQAKKIRSHENENMIALVEATQGENPKAAAQIEKWKAEKTKYEQDAEAASERAKEAAAESTLLQKQSEAEEHKASWLDLGELTVQVSLVLCSVAILAKRHAFWIAGLIIASVGICIGAYALTLSTTAGEAPAGSQPAAVHGG